MERFGEKLRALRAREGMTLRELADVLGYASNSYLAALEAGKKKPTAELAMKVARLFHVTIDQLLWDDVEIPPITSGQDATG